MKIQRLIIRIVLCLLMFGTCGLPFPTSAQLRSSINWSDDNPDGLICTRIRINREGDKGTVWVKFDGDILDVHGDLIGHEMLEGDSASYTYSPVLYRAVNQGSSVLFNGRFASVSVNKRARNAVRTFVILYSTSLNGVYFTTARGQLYVPILTTTGRRHGSISFERSGKFGETTCPEWWWE